MKVRHFLILAVLALSGFMTGCREILEDSEMKGILKVDKSAYGNDYLEFNDPESKLVRFIHPGRKIVQIKRKNLSELGVVMMDSRRVQLAKISVPMKAFSAQDDSFFMPAKSMKQQWDLRGQRRKVFLKVEVLPRSGGERCAVAKCQGLSCSGFKGPVFRVIDYRYDYDLKFMPENTKLVWGAFTATGEFRTDVINENSDVCQPATTVYPAAREVFE